MPDIIISHPSQRIEGEIALGGSKSITNRAYIIRALCNHDFEITNASQSDDSRSLLQLLTQKQGVLDAGHAGTTFRFLTAYLAFKEGSQVLTGSSRMLQRPIGPLVDALRQLGANITYLEKEGYPPIRIDEVRRQSNNSVVLPADISSQFISALLMIGPTLPDGLEIQLTGELVSEPYLRMTVDMMAVFGVEVQWENNRLLVPPQTYQARPYVVEADWSSASYYFAMAALAKRAKIVLKGLFLPSIQGDSGIANIAENFGVKTTVDDEGSLIIEKQEDKAPGLFEYDFVQQPDIAQTVFALCAGLGTAGLFAGLQTLRIKETDRIAAMQQELAKAGVLLSKVPSRFHKNSEDELYMQEGKAHFNDIPVFETYHDHRMAMALAPLALLHEIVIRDASVVSKSYPQFWSDINSLGFETKEA